MYQIKLLSEKKMARKMDDKEGDLSDRYEIDQPGFIREDIHESQDLRIKKNGQTSSYYRGPLKILRPLPGTLNKPECHSISDRSLVILGICIHIRTYTYLYPFLSVSLPI